MFPLSSNLCPNKIGLGMITVLLSAASFVTSMKCRTSVDAGMKWTVDCSAHNLSATPYPLNLHPVVSLILSHNVFVHLTELQFSNWTEISYLDLSFNEIEIVDEDSFKGLRDLSELNLIHNHIQVLSSNITKHLPKLKILNLSSNKLKLISQGSFEYSPMLLKLYLGNNVALGKSLESFVNLSSILNLVSLDISNTSLSKVSDNFLGNTSRLITLNIAYNPLVKLPNIFFSLRSLNISGTFLETINPGFLSNSDSLRKLTIENMPSLTEMQSKAFGGLISLEDLYINNCSKLDLISEDIFGDTQPKLKRIIISNCALITLSKTLQPLLIHTEDLNFQGNPWICDGRISWLASLNILPNHTFNLRCDRPPAARGMPLKDFFKPRRPHSWSSMIRASILVALVAVLVASVVGIIRHSKKEKPETYCQLQDISLQDRSTQQL